ncbi:wax synthase family protein [Aspergillus thermomutatus]|uniref:Wax synthase domain-containing protein n=1 Tax=Aspergillus thermomutatus TaxID=41047 RepID=A0A397G4Q5_ASPTH|nr:uncharacterized protein CDV56_101185 [Aspergillus thermomutatus]RHZ46021.1 hypothetical protein CDV56_101185 [Aspergillus thermomutatus]
MGLLHLTVSLAVQGVIVTSAICFTSRYSLWRAAAVPLVAFTTYQAWLALDLFDNNQLVNPMTAAFVVGFGLQHFNLLCVARIDAEEIKHQIQRQTVTKGAETAVSTWTCLRWTCYLLTTLRGIDTPYQVKAIPRGNKASASRVGFLVRTLLIIGAKYLVLDLMTVSPASKDDSIRYFGPGREYLVLRPNGLPPATLQEVLIHLGVAFLGWGPIGSWFIDVHYRVLAVVSVGLGVSSPHQWPALFGSITDTYTLRGFWGGFWHQSFRWPMQSIASCVCRDLLRLPRPSLVERYLNVTCVFAISAFLHITIDGRADIWLPHSGALRCFLVQPLGIMLEDAVQEAFRRFRGGPNHHTTIWTRLIGYLWVWGFLTLLAPLYNFPLFRYQDPTKNGVPFSVIKFARALSGE